MLHDIFELVGKGAEELKSKIRDLLSSYETLKAEKAELAHSLAQQTRQYEITYQDLKERIIERDKLKVERDQLQERYKSANSTVNALATEVKVLLEKLSGGNDPYYEELQNKLDKSEAIAKDLFEDVCKLQKEKDNGFFMDVLKTNRIVTENSLLSKMLKQVRALCDISDQKVRYQEEVIGQRNSMIAGLQKQIQVFEEMKDVHEMYAGIAPWSIPRPNTPIEFFDIRWQTETRIQGIEEKSIHVGAFPIKIILDSRIPEGTIFIK